MAVPDALVDAVALVGSKDRIRDRIQLWQDCPIKTLNITAFSLDALALYGGGNPLTIPKYDWDVGATL